MRLTERELRAQYDRAKTNWAFIRAVENELGIPPFVLYALGSRETNLRNMVGDGGHGHGIWQRDDRSFDIPEDYLQTPRRQALDAGRLLMSHLVYFSTRQPDPLACAVAAYNAGRGGVLKVLGAGKDADEATTGRDYSEDVLQRWSHMIGWYYGDA